MTNENAVQGVTRSGRLAHPDDEHGSELYHFDAQGKLLERYSPPGVGRHDLNDLALYRSSAIYVTDTDANLTYRFDRKTHLFTPLNLPRPQLFPNGITLSQDSTGLYIADCLGVIAMDLRDNSAHAYSALAWSRMGTGSAAFQRVKKS